MPSDIILQKNLIADNDYDKSRNLLYPTQFSFYCTLYPELKLNIHAINIPSVSLTENIMVTPFTGLKLLPSNIAYDPISVSFYPDAEMENYKILNEWVVGIGFPEDFNQYRSEVDRRYFQEIIARADDYYLRSDALIVCRNMYGTVVKTFKFCGFFPTSIPEVPFESQNKEQVMSLTVNFAYDYYTIENPRLPLRYTGAVGDVNVILARIRRKMFDDYIKGKANEETATKDFDDVVKDENADFYVFLDSLIEKNIVSKRMMRIVSEVKDMVVKKKDAIEDRETAVNLLTEEDEAKLNVFFGTLRRYLPSYDDYGSDYKSVMMSIKRYKPDDVLTAWDRLYKDRAVNKIITRYKATTKTEPQ